MLFPTYHARFSKPGSRSVAWKLVRRHLRSVQPSLDLRRVTVLVRPLLRSPHQLTALIADNENVRDAQNALSENISNFGR